MSSSRADASANDTELEPALPITVIMNAGSGRRDAENDRRQIEEALERSGREYRIVPCARPGDLERAAREAVADAARHPRIVAAAGGDGTINAVAGHVLGTGLSLGVIPLGTYNFFARDLGIPLDPARAAAALVDGRVRRVHVAHVNGRLFLINATFGLYRRVLEERERYKHRFGRYRFVTVPSALITLMRNHRTYRVELELDGRPAVLHTLMLFFGLNTLQLEKLDLDVAECTARGRLAVLALRPMSRLELLGIALRGALQRLEQAPNLQRHCASRVDVYWRGARRIRVAVDGETIECEVPLRFEVLPDALPVVVPRSPEPRE